MLAKANELRSGMLAVSCSGKLTGARGGKAGVVGNDRSGHPQ